MTSSTSSITLCKDSKQNKPEPLQLTTATLNHQSDLSPVTIPQTTTMKTFSWSWSQQENSKDDPASTNDAKS